MFNFIKLSHLNQLVNKIKELYVAKENGKGLSANDLSNDLKSKYDAAYTHSQASHAPAGAQANVIESIKVNGVAQTISSKAVNILVPDAYTKAEVDAMVNGIIGASDAMVFKGTLGTGGTITALPASHKVGDTYKVITTGTYAGVDCEIGDMVICITGGTTATNAHWAVVQSNIDGAVTGPTSATANAIALFNGATGKVIANSSKTIVNSISGSTNVPTDDAVKAFVEGKGYILESDIVEVTAAEIDALFV